jgi:hypothetical protein
MPNETRLFPLLGALTTLIVAIGGLAPLAKEISSLIAAGHPSQTAITIVVQNLGPAWACGAKQISGMAPCVPSSLLPTPQTPSATTNTASTDSSASSASSRFPNKTLGTLEADIPISQTDWTLQSAEIPRVIHFDMRVEARVEDVQARSYLITLRREGKSVCSVRFDLDGAPSGLVAKAKGCDDDVPQNEQHVYTATINPPAEGVKVSMNARAQRPN